MSSLEKLPITVLIAAKNEEKNIAHCLSSLGPAERVVVVDSQSQDTTAQLARLAGAEVVQFHYGGGYPKKRQWALDTLAIHTPWVLLLDSDEAVPEPLWHEVARVLSSPHSRVAYFAKKGFHFLERRFRFGGFSHSAVILFQRGTARFERLVPDSAQGQDMEIHERLIVNGSLGRLRTPLIHYDRKNLEAYLDRHNRYSSWEARLRYSYLRSGLWGEDTIRPKLLGNPQEIRRFLKGLALRMPAEPQLWFAYHYICRLGFLEGRPGLIASLLRANYISQVRCKMYELWALDHLKAKPEA